MPDTTRRLFVLGTGLLVAGCAHGNGAGAAASKGGKPHEEEEVSPAEDLMREHGILNRLLLVYEDVARRVESPVAARPLPLDVLASSADIVRRFIEQYHEKLEEEFLFPRFEKANTLVDLVATLRRQHAAGRLLTDTILRIATSSTAPDRTPLVATIGSFVRMYRPHEAREDTVLFPAFRKLVTENEYRELGERFEEREHELFGKDGFEGVVARVAALETTLGIYDLNQFTPAL